MNGAQLVEFEPLTLRMAVMLRETKETPPTEQLAQKEHMNRDSPINQEAGNTAEIPAPDSCDINEESDELSDEAFIYCKV